MSSSQLGRITPEFQSALSHVELGHEDLRTHADLIELLGSIAFAHSLQQAQQFGAEFFDEQLEYEARAHAYWLTDEQLASKRQAFAPLVTYLRNQGPRKIESR